MQLITQNITASASQKMQNIQECGWEPLSYLMIAFQDQVF